MIFIDSQLPDMDGEAIAKEIRALPGHGQTSLIAMVVDDEGLEVDFLLEAGFNDQVHKPMTGSQLHNIAEGHSKMSEKIQSFLE